MVDMKRASQITVAALALLCALAPASASAAIVELGASKTAISPPKCPPGVTAAQCTIVLTRTTALETIRDSRAYPTTVTRTGFIVAWTIGLASLSPTRAGANKIITNQDMTYGGPTEASIVVLKRGARRSWTVVATSPLFQLQAFLGTVVQFPLPKPLVVVRGETIGLSIPTWAPVLSYDLPVKQFAYRQSRTSNCSNPAGSETAQLTPKQSTQYLCDYPGTRVEYTATEVTRPAPPTTYIRPAEEIRALAGVQRQLGWARPTGGQPLQGAPGR